MWRIPTVTHSVNVGGALLQPLLLFLVGQRARAVGQRLRVCVCHRGRHGEEFWNTREGGTLDGEQGTAFGVKKKAGHAWLNLAFPIFHTHMVLLVMTIRQIYAR